MSVGLDAGHFRHLHYLHEPDIIDLHRPSVEAFVRERFPGVAISFSDRAGDGVLSTADCLIAPAASWIRRVLDELPSLRWIHFMGSGTDPVLDLLRGRPHLLASKSSGVNAPAMAEFVIATILYFAKSLDRFAEQQRQRSWDRRWLVELTGRHLLIIGAGTTAEALAPRAEDLGLRVTAVARTAGPRHLLGHVTTVDSLPELLPRADFIACCLPLTTKTRGLIGREEFRAMGAEAVFINISRGGIVDEAALCEAARDGRIRGAAVDVFEEEPLPEDSPLWRCPSILITPHVAGTTDRYLARMLQSFETNWEALRSTGRLATPVDVSRQY